MRTLREIMNQRVDDHSDIEQHVAKLNELFQKLLAAYSNEIKPEFFYECYFVDHYPVHMIV